VPPPHAVVERYVRSVIHMPPGAIKRLFLGQFVRPASETGTGAARVEPAVGYLVELADGYLLFDTGIGVADAETEARYLPTRVPLASALRRVGAALQDVRVIVNCHLHLDHCGGNPLFPHVPIVVQRAELQAAWTPDYTVPDLVDFPGVTFNEVDGEVELVEGLVWVIPTPGHTPGHQSLVVRTPHGHVVCAGQSHESAQEYGSSILADLSSRTPGGVGDLPVPSWFARLQAFAPKRVLFAHDLAHLDDDALSVGTTSR
jgi:N-acyl homoserine lactone hydrolase